MSSKNTDIYIPKGHMLRPDIPTNRFVLLCIMLQVSLNEWAVYPADSKVTRDKVHIG